MSLRLLFEGSRDNMLLNYLPKVQEVHPNCTLSELKKYLLNKFVNEGHIRALSMPSNFYLAGVARYYFNGDLTENQTLNIFDENTEDKFIQEVCAKLSAVIRVLRNKYLDSEGTTWEQPEDFGTLAIVKLFRKYGKAIEKEMGIESGEEQPEEEKTKILDSNEKLTGYTYEIIYNHSELRKYETATSPGSWCITYETPYHYNTYTTRNRSFFVIFKQNGWENVQRPGTEPDGFPLDAYGISLMAIQLSKDDGHVVAGTTRWNHGAGSINVPGDADQKINFNILSRLTGITEAGLKSIRDVWKHNSKYLVAKDDDKTTKVSREEMKEVVRLLNYIQICINDGQNPFLKTRAFPNGMLNTARLIDTTNNNSGLIGGDDVAKIWKRFCMECSVTVNGTTFYVIVDKGKIMTKTLTNGPSPHGLQPETGRIRLNFAQNGKCCLYDMIHHKVIEKENKYWFADRQLGFHPNVSIVKIGPRQYSIYDNRNGKFLTVKGYDTFEYVTLTDGDIVGCLDVEGRYLIVIIDSSARDYFTLDCETMSVVGLGYGVLPTNVVGRNFESNSDFIIARKVKNLDIDRSGQKILFRGNYEEYSLYSTVDKEYLEIDGKKEFNYIDMISKRYAKINDGERRHVIFSDDFECKFSDKVYDLEEKKFVDVNGSENVYAEGDYCGNFVFVNQNCDYKLLFNGEHGTSCQTGKIPKFRYLDLSRISGENRKFLVFKIYVEAGGIKYILFYNGSTIKDKNGNDMMFDKAECIYPEDGPERYYPIGRVFYNDNFECKVYYREEKPFEMKKINTEEINEMVENFYRLANYLI